MNDSMDSDMSMNSEEEEIMRKMKEQMITHPEE